MDARVKPAHDAEIPAALAIIDSNLKQPTLRRPYSLRRGGAVAFPARGGAFLPPPATGAWGSRPRPQGAWGSPPAICRGDGAPSGASNSPRLAARRALRSARSPLGAPCAAISDPGSALPGPRPFFPRPSMCRLNTVPHRRRSDLQGGPVQQAPCGAVVMPPGRVPGPPECRLTRPARGRRTLLRLRDRLRRRPSMSKVRAGCKGNVAEI